MLRLNPEVLVSFFSQESQPIHLHLERTWNVLKKNKAEVQTICPPTVGEKGTETCHGKQVGLSLQLLKFWESFPKTPGQFAFLFQDLTLLDPKTYELRFWSRLKKKKRGYIVGASSVTSHHRYKSSSAQVSILRLLQMKQRPEQGGGKHCFSPLQIFSPGENPVFILMTLNKVLAKKAMSLAVGIHVKTQTRNSHLTPSPPNCRLDNIGIYFALDKKKKGFGDPSPYAGLF